MKDLKEQIARPRKIALYASLTMEFAYVTEVTYTSHDEFYRQLPEGQLRERPIEGYVRVTEPVDVVFSAIDNDSMVRNAVESLNEEERKARQELEDKLAKIRGYKNQLLALTHQSEEVV